MPNLGKVEEELKNGRLWKARDRLLGLFSTYPTSQEVMELLGEVYYRMGDLPEAGRYWFLTEYADDDAHKTESINAYKERLGNNAYLIIKQLPTRLPHDKYGPKTFSKLKELMEQSPMDEIQFTESFTIKTDEATTYSRGRLRWIAWRARIVEVLGLIFLLGPWLVGFFTILIWLTSFIAPSLGKYLLTHWFDLLDLIKTD